MIPLLQSLFAHQAWADSALLSAVGAHPDAWSDEELRKFLYHIALVQSYFLTIFQGTQFDPATMNGPETLEGMVAFAKQVHEQQHAFVNGVDEASLNRTLSFPHQPETRLTMAQGMMQVVMHSQGHRAACATRLRKLGGSSPLLDYIIWLKERPAPAWA